MSSILEIESGKIKFNVRIVENGDEYGLKNCLTHNEKEPLVEFYDTRYPHTEYGQFVSRYNIKTLLRNQKDSGICLEGRVPDWYIEGKEMNKVIDWLQEHINKDNHKPKFK